MSNKMLVSIIVAIIVLGAVGAGYFYWQQTKPLTSVPLSEPVDTQVYSSTTPANINTITQMNEASNTPTSTADAAPGQCVRDFNAAKLADNANINIANREVEIDVAGFGAIDLELYNTDAPLAVQNFLRLTDSGYYNCLTFHRIAAGFVIQGGDPNGNGTGGVSAFGKPFADELNPDTASYKAGYVKGVLAMANSGPNTNGSQFFIMLADNPLPHNYTIFGKVISGQSVVDAIGQLPINPVNGPTDGSPKTPVVMQSVKIIK
jgi:cyclophilin family peptidyl-prolyl cis-trans isomerase